MLLTLVYLPFNLVNTCMLLRAERPLRLSYRHEGVNIPNIDCCTFPNFIGGACSLPVNFTSTSGCLFAAEQLSATLTVHTNGASFCMMRNELGKFQGYFPLLNSGFSFRFPDPPPPPPTASPFSGTFRENSMNGSMQNLNKQ